MLHALSLLSPASGALCTVRITAPDLESRTTTRGQLDNQLGAEWEGTDETEIGGEEQWRQMGSVTAVGKILDADVAANNNSMYCTKLASTFRGCQLDFLY